jgi:hypothetical protein
VSRPARRWLDIPAISRSVSALRRSRLAEPAFVAFVAAAVSTVFFQRLLFRGGVYVGIDWLGIHVPFRRFISEAIADREFPLWMPDVWLGVPFLGNGDAAFLYPLQFPFFAAEPERAIVVVLWLHAALAIGTMYALCRVSYRIGPGGSLAAGVIYAFGGWALPHTNFLSFVYIHPWIPLALLCFERAIERSWRWAIGGMLAIALCLLSGNPQELWFSAAWLPVLAIPIVCRSTRLASRAGRAIGAAVLMAVGGAGLAAAQVAPQAELVRQTSRGGGLSFEEATLFPLSGVPHWLLLLPDYARDFAGENGAWIGAVGIGLAAAGILRLGRKPGRRLELAAWLLLIAISWVLATGAATPLYRVVYTIVPGVDHFRFPVRWLFPLTIAFAVLAGHGVDALRGMRRSQDARRAAAIFGVLGITVAALAASGALDWLIDTWTERRQLWIASAIGIAVAAAAAVAARAGWLSSRAAGLLVAGGLAFELFGAGSFLDHNRPQPADFYSRFRVIPAVAGIPGGRALPAAPEPLEGWPTAPEQIRANTGILAGVSSVGGLGGSIPAEQVAALDRLAFAPLRADDPVAAARTELWRLLDVRTVVGRGEQANLAANRSLTPVASELAFVLYRLDPPGERARALCGAQYVGTVEEALDRILSPDFHADRLYLEGSGSEPGPAGRCGTVDVVDARRNGLTLDATLERDGWVLLADAWYPGWRASVDGEEAAIRRADGVLRAVAVPAGRHRVEFEYSPASFLLGAWISVGTASLLLLGAVGALVRRPSRGRPRAARR